jgi:hypothetical protein
MIHPKSGFYTENDFEYVSVSTVIGETAEIYTPGKLKGLEIWRANEPDWQEITQRGQRRGTLVHAEVEAFFKGGYDVHAEDHATFDELISYNIPEYMLHLSTLLEELRAQNTLSYDGLLSPSVLIEKQLISDIGTAGTPDIRLYFNNRYTIWDWKSVRSYKEEGVKKKNKSISGYGDAKIQIGAYALMHNLMTPKTGLPKITQGVVAIVYDWREPHVHVMDKEELAKAASEFVERFQTYCALKEARFPRHISANPSFTESAF